MNGPGMSTCTKGTVVEQRGLDGHNDVPLVKEASVRPKAMAAAT